MLLLYLGSAHPLLQSGMATLFCRTSYNAKDPLKFLLPLILLERHIRWLIGLLAKHTWDNDESIDPLSPLHVELYALLRADAASTNYVRL